MLLVIFLLLLAAVGLMLLAFMKPKAKTDVQTRLRRVKGQQHKPKKPKTLFEKLENAVQPVAQKRLKEGEDRSLRSKLDAAGLYSTNPIQLVSRQILYAGVVPIIFALANWVVLEFPQAVALIGCIAMAMVGYNLPLWQLDSQAEKRRTLILKDLPTMLDLMTTCVEAGLSLQAAMVKVCEISKPSPLKSELERTLKEIQLGRPRSDALRELGKRVKLKELNSVAIAMVQAETMGASISQTLRVQGEIMREARWQRAQELAQKAPLKMIFPVTFLIFPVIFIVIFGPIVISLLEGL